MNRILFFTVLALLAFPACKSKTPQAKETVSGDTAKAGTQTVQLTEQQYKAAGIVVSDADSGSVNQLLKVNGTIEAPPEDRHTISFPLGGFLKSASLVLGQHVSKGSVLATMEDASFIQLQQDYLLSKSRLGFLQADYERQLELSKTQSSSQRTFQQAQTELESQRVTTVALGEKLKLIGIHPETLTAQRISRTVNVYSPVDGYISRVNANPGKYAAPTDVLFEVIDPSEVHLSLTVFEGSAAYLKIGQKISYTTQQGLRKSGIAVIEYIAPSFDENRAVEVHCHIDPRSPKLLPGSFVTAEIQVASQTGITVPSDAVVSWHNKQYVFVQEAPLAFTLLPVTVTGSSNGKTAIASVLPLGKKLVTANAYTLLTMLKNTGEE